MEISYKPPISRISIAGQNKKADRRLKPSCRLFGSQSTCHWVSVVWRCGWWSNSPMGLGRRVYVDDWRILVVTGCQLLLLGLHSPTCWQQPPRHMGLVGVLDQTRASWTLDMLRESSLWVWVELCCDTMRLGWGLIWHAAEVQIKYCILSFCSRKVQIQVLKYFGSLR